MTNDVVKPTDTERCEAIEEQIAELVRQHNELAKRSDELIYKLEVSRR